MRNSSPAFPLLVVDIGGTHVRFGWVAAAGEIIQEIRAYRCGDFASPVDAAHRYLSEAGVPQVAHAAVAIASVVARGPIKLTNSQWIFEADAFGASVGAGTVEVFNDFEAIALVLPFLTARDYQIVGTAAFNPALPLAVLGPGTGLGMAGIQPVRGQPGNWQTICGEGGHTSIPSATRYQHAVIAAARHEIAHVSAEGLVSGLGLPTLYRAVARVEGLAAEDIGAAEIGARGASGSDPLAARTLDTFCGFLGSIAGNLALTLGAQGGVFIAGGIVPQWGDFFAGSSFREHFEDKGRYRDYLAAIATGVITAPYPGLMGLAQHAARSLPAR
ncbi:MAG TPA: glucokinase [Usitatibacteraceae bacterium]|nr:glucokinase [Usitatibacteraceae bacterium]